MNNEQVRLARLLVLVPAIVLIAVANAQEPARTWRLDFNETGGLGNEIFSFDRVVIEPFAWPDNRGNDVDTTPTGNFWFEIVGANGRVIFSRGYDPAFAESVRVRHDPREHDTYGGGGLYNVFSTAAAGNDFVDYLFVHEAMSKDFQARRVKLRAEKRPESEMTRLFREELEAETKLLGSAEHANTVGVFQGANYDARAFYRPQVDCIMFTRDKVPFCRVCQRALTAIIDRHTAQSRGVDE